MLDIQNEHQLKQVEGKPIFAQSLKLTFLMISWS